MSHIGLVLDKWEKDVLAKRFVSVEYDDAKHADNLLHDKELLLEDARAFMSTLTPRTALICKLYYTVGHTQLEIAESENLTVKTVEGVLYRVGKKLRERYDT